VTKNQKNSKQQQEADAILPFIFNIVLDIVVREGQEEYQEINCGQYLPLLT